MTLTEYTSSLFRVSGLRGIPLSGTFELTSRCNLDCRMCYVHLRKNDAQAMKNELPADEWLKIAAEAAGAGTLFILLTGGEPLLRPDFSEIYLGCKKLGLIVSVNTNGTLIDEKTADLFASSPPARINLTLYGCSSKTYGSLCGHPDAYQRARTALRLLTERGIRVKLNHTVTAFNAADTDAIRKIGAEYGLPVQTASYLFPPLRASGSLSKNEARLSPEEAAKVRFDFDIGRFSPEEAEKRVRLFLAGLRPAGYEAECGGHPTEGISCRAGDSAFWITANGEMRPCGMMESPSFPVRSGFSEGWEYLRTARRSVTMPARCTACRDRFSCEVCPASAYAETGKENEAPPYLCRMTKKFTDLCAAYVRKRNAASPDEKETK